jgi:DNA modification methylase
MSRGIDIKNWKNYGHILTDSLWLFPKRGMGGDSHYHGNFIPQIPEQLILRYTQPGDVVVDPFLGSGTTMDVALRLGRKCHCIELNDVLAKSVYARIAAEGYPPSQADILSGDATSRLAWEQVIGGAKAVQKAPITLVILHPPYHNIVKFTDNPNDLSNQTSVERFIGMLDKVVSHAYQALSEKGTLAIIIGDMYTKGRVIPLGSRVLELLRFWEGSLELKGIIVKDIQGNEQGKGKDANLWRYRALRSGFYIFKHEYIYVLEKVK